MLHHFSRPEFIMFDIISELFFIVLPSVQNIRVYQMFKDFFVKKLILRMKKPRNVEEFELYFSAHFVYKIHL